MKNKYVILGGGIAGIGAQYRLGKEASIYEARDSVGGLCDSFNINSFTFDNAVHLSFAKDDVVRGVFDKTQYHAHAPESMNWCWGNWVRHPVQNNSIHLPIDERIRIIKSFCYRNTDTDVKNYKEWLEYQYGEYFATKYPGCYTRKYWCCDADKLSTKWIVGRMYQPSLDEVLEGAMKTETPNTYYTKEMRYPLKGGYKAFFDHIVDYENVHTGYKAVSIDPISKTVEFENGQTVEYENLISTLPLNQITDIIKGCPENVRSASKHLKATSICLVSVGFKRKVSIPSIWFYMYDEKMPAARAYSPSLKAESNAPKGKSSLQFEIYYTDDKPLPMTAEEIKETVIGNIVEMGIANKEDIEFVDVRYVPYANVIFYHGMEEKRQMVIDYIESLGIQTVGRFGRWEYLWSDQSFLSGYNVK